MLLREGRPLGGRAQEKEIRSLGASLEGNTWRSVLASLSALQLSQDEWVLQAMYPCLDAIPCEDPKGAGKHTWVQVLKTTNLKKPWAFDVGSPRVFVTVTQNERERPNYKSHS